MLLYLSIYYLYLYYSVVKWKPTIKDLFSCFCFLDLKKIEKMTFGL